MSAPCVFSGPQTEIVYGHINVTHSSRSEHPSIIFYQDHNRLICSQDTCRWAYHEKFANRGCQRPISGTRCGGSLILPADATFLSDTSLAPRQDRQQPSTPYPSPGSPSHADIQPEQQVTTNKTYNHQDLITLAIEATESLQFQESHQVEAESFNALMHQATTLPTTSIKHIPRSCRPALAQIWAKEFRHACQKGLWGFARIHIFAKSVLCLPPRRKKKNRELVHTLLSRRLSQWRNGEIKQLYLEASSQHNTQIPLTQPEPLSWAKKARPFKPWVHLASDLVMIPQPSRNSSVATLHINSRR